MKKILKRSSFLWILLFCLFGCTSDPELSTQGNAETRAGHVSDYYWYYNEKIPLTISSQKFFVVIEEEELTKAERSLRSSGSGLLNDISKKFTDSELDLGKKTILSTKNLKAATIDKNQLEELSSSATLHYSAPYYYSMEGGELPLSSTFAVKLVNKSDLPILEQMAALHNVIILGQNNENSLWYTLICSNNSTGNALEIANIFYESGKFLASEPNFMACTIDCAVDSLYSSQWNLPYINFCDTKAITWSGTEIIVAVVDSGVEKDHPDLPNIYRISYDGPTGINSSNVYSSHGTMCAGIIGAANNDIGIAGIAPQVKIMSLSNKFNNEYPGYQYSIRDLANSIMFAATNGAHVISNSWSSAGRSAQVADAVEYAQTRGRGGLGCVVVASTGNNYSSTVSYPAALNADVLAVGAMDRNYTRWSYSQYGAALDVMAPAGVPTTDIGKNYTTSFGGTSAACPHVAGVAALMLSKNPNLTQTQVAERIKRTSQKVGGYTYTTLSAYPYGKWNSEMGYGLVDANAAIYEKGNLYFPSGTNSVASGQIFEVMWIGEDYPDGGFIWEVPKSMNMGVETLINTSTHFKAKLTFKNSGSGGIQPANATQTMSYRNPRNLTTGIALETFRVSVGNY